jgi:hypothetical protein
MIDLSGSNLDQLPPASCGHSASKQTIPACACKGGWQQPHDFLAAPIHDSRGEVDGLVLVLHDKSIEQQYINHLSWQAAHDALTGLYNRREFEQRVTRASAA